MILLAPASVASGRHPEPKTLRRFAGQSFCTEKGGAFSPIQGFDWICGYGVLETFWRTLGLYVKPFGRGVNRIHCRSVIEPHSGIIRSYTGGSSLGIGHPPNHLLWFSFTQKTNLTGSLQNAEPPQGPQPTHSWQSRRGSRQQRLPEDCGSGQLQRCSLQENATQN